MCTIYVVEIKMLLSCAVIMPLIGAFVLAYSKSRFFLFYNVFHIVKYSGILQTEKSTFHVVRTTVCP